MIHIKYCNNVSHSRPATPEEFAIDYRKREEALAYAKEAGMYSQAQMMEAQRILETFHGYRRCTLKNAEGSRWS